MEDTGANPGVGDLCTYVWRKVGSACPRLAPIALRGCDMTRHGNMLIGTALHRVHRFFFALLPWVYAHTHSPPNPNVWELRIGKKAYAFPPKDWSEKRNPRIMPLEHTANASTRL